MARFVFIATAFMQTLYSKIFTATIIIIIIIITKTEKREEKDRGERGERGESDLPEHMRA